MRAITLALLSNCTTTSDSLHPFWICQCHKIFRRISARIPLNGFMCCCRQQSFGTCVMCKISCLSVGANLWTQLQIEFLFLPSDSSLMAGGSMTTRPPRLWRWSRTTSSRCTRSRPGETAAAATEDDGRRMLHDQEPPRTI